MKEILRQNKKIIINTDIDGVLSGLILTNYLNCEVVGFSNSDDTVWIDRSKVNSIYDAVYIDMFVPRSDVICIDQHIVAVNNNHHNILSKNKNKINPNIDNPRFHLPNQSYYIKYPFGTVHYIIAVLASQGIAIQFDLKRPVGDIFFADILLRADDAMKTTVDSNYVANARSWWTWLLHKSGNASCIVGMIDYLNSLNGAKVATIKSKTTNLFMSSDRFACSSPDGGFNQILLANGNLKPNVIDYLRFVAMSFGLNCFNTNLNLTMQKGTVNRISLNQNQILELIIHNKINDREIFSYAFVRSSNRPQSFSYTVM